MRKRPSFRTRSGGRHWGKAQPSRERPTKTQAVRVNQTTADTADALAVVRRVLGRGSRD